MLQIQTSARAPVRVDLPGGGHILFKPASNTGKQIARQAAFAAVAAGEGIAVANVAYTYALAKWGALAWEGIGDQDGEPLPVNPDNVELLLEQSPSTYEAVNSTYANAVLELEAEKNGSAPAPVGSSPDSKTAKRVRARPGAAGTTAQPASRKRRPAAAKAARSS